MSFFETSEIGVNVYKNIILEYYIKTIAKQIIAYNIYTEPEVVMGDDIYSFKIEIDRRVSFEIPDYYWRKTLNVEYMGINKGKKLFTFSFSDKTIIDDMLFIYNNYYKKNEGINLPNILFILSTYLSQVFCPTSKKRIIVRSNFMIYGNNIKVNPSNFTHIFKFKRGIPEDKDKYILNWCAEFVNRREMICYILDKYLSELETRF